MKIKSMIYPCSIYKLFLNTLKISTFQGNLDKAGSYI
jgi:hypothetical protein